MIFRLYAVRLYQWTFCHATKLSNLVAGFLILTPEF
jgi:hypothetical protein